MNFCRICLSTDIYGEISQLQLNNSDEKLNFTVVIEFCLNLQITKNSKITLFLCEECYNQIVSFYKFKKLALKNDKYLKSLERNDLSVSLVTVEFQEKDLKHEKSDYCWVEVKQEPDSILSQKKEPVPGTADKHISFNNEGLSMVKQHKDFNFIATNRKRGRSKKDKTEKAKDHSPKKVKQVCEECGKSVLNLRMHSIIHINQKWKGKVEYNVKPAQRRRQVTVPKISISNEIEKTEHKKNIV